MSQTFILSPLLCGVHLVIPPSLFPVLPRFALERLDMYKRHKAEFLDLQLPPPS